MGACSPSASVAIDMRILTLYRRLNSCPLALKRRQISPTTPFSVTVASGLRTYRRLPHATISWVATHRPRLLACHSRPPSSGAIVVRIHPRSLKSWPIPLIVTSSQGWSFCTPTVRMMCCWESVGLSAMIFPRTDATCPQRIGVCPSPLMAPAGSGGERITGIQVEVSCRDIQGLKVGMLASSCGERHR